MDQHSSSVGINSLIFRNDIHSYIMESFSVSGVPLKDLRSPKQLHELQQNIIQSIKIGNFCQLEDFYFYQEEFSESPASIFSMEWNNKHMFFIGIPWSLVEENKKRDKTIGQRVKFKEDEKIHITGNVISRKLNSICQEIYQQFVDQMGAPGDNVIIFFHNKPVNHHSTLSKPGSLEEFQSRHNNLLIPDGVFNNRSISLKLSQQLMSIRSDAVNCRGDIAVKVNDYYSDMADSMSSYLKDLSLNNKEKLTRIRTSVSKGFKDEYTLLLSEFYGNYPDSLTISNLEQKMVRQSVRNKENVLSRLNTLVISSGHQFTYIPDFSKVDIKLKSDIKPTSMIPYMVIEDESKETVRYLKGWGNNNLMIDSARSQSQNMSLNTYINRGSKESVQISKGMKFKMEVISYASKLISDWTNPVGDASFIPQQIEDDEIKRLEENESSEGSNRFHSITRNVLDKSLLFAEEERGESTFEKAGHFLQKHKRLPLVRGVYQMKFNYHHLAINKRSMAKYTIRRCSVSLFKNKSPRDIISKHLSGEITVLDDELLLNKRKKSNMEHNSALNKPYHSEFIRGAPVDQRDSKKATGIDKVTIGPDESAREVIDEEGEANMKFHNTSILELDCGQNCLYEQDKKFFYMKETPSVDFVLGITRTLEGRRLSIESKVFKGILKVLDTNPSFARVCTKRDLVIQLSSSLTVKNRFKELYKHTNNLGRIETLTKLSQPLEKFNSIWYTARYATDDIAFADMAFRVKRIEISNNVVNFVWQSIDKNSIQDSIRSPYEILSMSVDFITNMTKSLLLGLNNKFMHSYISFLSEIRSINRQQFSLMSTQIRYFTLVNASETFNFDGIMSKLDGVSLSSRVECKFLCDMISSSYFASIFKQSKCNSQLFSHTIDFNPCLTFRTPILGLMTNDMHTMVNCFYFCNMFNKEKVYTDSYLALDYNTILDQEDRFLKAKKNYLEFMGCSQNLLELIDNGRLQELFDNKRLFANEINHIKKLMKTRQDLLTTQKIVKRSVNSRAKYMLDTMPEVEYIERYVDPRNSMEKSNQFGGYLLIKMITSLYFGMKSPVSMDLTKLKKVSVRRMSNLHGSVSDKRTISNPKKLSSHKIGVFQTLRKASALFRSLHDMFIDNPNSKVNMYNVYLRLKFESSIKIIAYNRIFDKDQTGGNREITAMSVHAILLAGISELMMAGISRSMEEDIIMSKNRELDLSIFFSQIYDKYNNKSRRNIKFHLNIDRSKWATNTRQEDLLILNSCFCENQITQCLLVDLYLMQSDKKVLFPGSLLIKYLKHRERAIASGKPIWLYENINSGESPQDRTLGFGEKLLKQDQRSFQESKSKSLVNQPSPSVGSGFPQGTQGVTSSVYACLASRFCSRLMSQSVEFNCRHIKVRTRFVVSSDDMYRFVSISLDNRISENNICKGPSGRVGFRHAVVSTLILNLLRIGQSLFNMIMNPQKSLSNPTTAEMTSVFYEGGKMAIPTVKFSRSLLNTGNIDSHELDLVSAEKTGENLLLKGTTLLGALTLATCNQELVLDQHMMIPKKTTNNPNYWTNVSFSHLDSVFIERTIPRYENMFKSDHLRALKVTMMIMALEQSIDSHLMVEDTMGHLSWNHKSNQKSFVKNSLLGIMSAPYVSKTVVRMARELEGYTKLGIDSTLHGMPDTISNYSSYLRDHEDSLDPSIDIRLQFLRRHLELRGYTNRKRYNLSGNTIVNQGRKSIPMTSKELINYMMMIDAISLVDNNRGKICSMLESVNRKLPAVFNTFGDNYYIKNIDAPLKSYNAMKKLELAVNPLLTYSDVMISHAIHIRRDVIVDESSVMSFVEFTQPQLHTENPFVTEPMSKEQFMWRAHHTYRERHSFANLNMSSRKYRNVDHTISAAYKIYRDNSDRLLRKLSGSHRGVTTQTIVQQVPRNKVIHIKQSEFLTALLSHSITNRSKRLVRYNPFSLEKDFEGVEITPYGNDMIYKQTSAILLDIHNMREHALHSNYPTMPSVDINRIRELITDMSRPNEEHIDIVDEMRFKEIGVLFKNVSTSAEGQLAVLYSRASLGLPTKATLSNFLNMPQTPDDSSVSSNLTRISTTVMGKLKYETLQQYETFVLNTSVLADKITGRTLLTYTMVIAPDIGFDLQRVVDVTITSGDLPEFSKKLILNNMSKCYNTTGFKGRPTTITIPCSEQITLKTAHEYSGPVFDSNIKLDITINVIMESKKANIPVRENNSMCVLLECPILVQLEDSIVSMPSIIRLVPTVFGRKHSLQGYFTIDLLELSEATINSMNRDIRKHTVIAQKNYRTLGMHQTADSQHGLLIIENILKRNTKDVLIKLTNRGNILGVSIISNKSLVSFANTTPYFLARQLQGVCLYVTATTRAGFMNTYDVKLFGKCLLVCRNPTTKRKQYLYIEGLEAIKEKPVKIEDIMGNLNFEIYFNEL